MTLTDELAPCPFCGGKADVHGPIGGTFSIYQSHDLDCPVGGGERNYETEAEAITAWNTRAKSDQWQDIATAPRDGTPEREGTWILLFWPDEGIGLGRWRHNHRTGQPQGDG